MSDKELERLIINRRQVVPNLPFRRIALAVVSKARNRLARMLLEREPSVEAKVQLNLKIGDYGAAVKVALRGGDPSLAHAALAQATEAQDGLQQMVNVILQNYNVLLTFYQENKIFKQK